MEQNEKFDEVQYWLERHEQLQGDVRSVGKIGSGREDSIEASRQKAELLRRVFKHLYPEAGLRKMLDVGCGVGRFAPIFVELGFN